MSGARVATIGFGAWGTAVSALLARHGHTVRAWTPEQDVVTESAAARENRRYLPGCALPPSLEVTGDARRALEDAHFVLWAIPTQALDEVARTVAAVVPAPAVQVSLAKGFERGSHRRPSEIVRAHLPDRRLAALLGPSHAEEVAVGQPTVVTACSDDAKTSEEVQALFQGETFRVYRNDDLIGSECGAALKNVVAIAAGIADGLGFGDNAKGALLTRGLAELSRLGEALGGRRQTFFGLTGLGDLITTCFSRHSRNRRVGDEVGRGRALDDVLRDLAQVAEGVPTAPAALEMARARGVPVPITEQVVAVLFTGKSPRAALRDLMARDPGAE